MSASESGDKPKKIDKKWQKKRRRVALGENGLPIEPIYAPRQMAKYGYVVVNGGGSVCVT